MRARTAVPSVARSSSVSRSPSRPAATATSRSGGDSLPAAETQRRLPERGRGNDAGLLLALPEAAPCALGQLSLLWREAVAPAEALRDPQRRPPPEAAGIHSPPAETQRRLPERGRGNDAGLLLALQEAAPCALGQLSLLWREAVGPAEALQRPAATATSRSGGDSLPAAEGRGERPAGHGDR